MAGPLDDIDQRILAELGRDGRMSIRTLAERLHISRANAYARVQRLRETNVIKGFRAEELAVPGLTLFAVEEPENHLAPHYLGRILKLLLVIAESPRAQVVLTSHSPAILRRIDPAAVRHLRLDLGALEDEVLPSLEALWLPFPRLSSDSEQ